MAKRVLAVAAVLAAMGMGISVRGADAGGPVPDGKVHKLELKDQQFQIDGRPIRLIAGEIHPGRIPPEFWEDRIKKIKAMGLNTVSVYIFWNQIEQKEGEFKFTGDTDVRRFIQLCQQNGLWVVLRVGTYVCAEWEFGGYPWWMLQHHDMKLRSADPKFLEYCQSYVSALGKQVADLQVNHGGPILMTQFENEYGRIDPYLYKLKDIFVKGGFDGQLMTCDHSGGVWNQMKGIPGVLRGYNGVKKQVAGRIEQARKVNSEENAGFPGGGPVFSPEVYTGWFELWGGTEKAVSVQSQVADAEWMLEQPNFSWAYYVVDGGTNFGYWAGSNSGRPMQTTYDYAAPIDEMGRVTPKYKALRELFEKQLKLDLPPIPADPKVIEVPAFTLKPAGTLVEWCPPPLSGKNTVSEHVKSMEDAGEGYGFIVYRKKFAEGVKGKLVLPVVRDYAWVMVDGAVVGEGMTSPPPRNAKGEAAQTERVVAEVDHPGACEVEILVHNLGRTSSPFDQGHSRKGLIEDPTLDGKAVTGWEIVPMPLEHGTADLGGGPLRVNGAPKGPSFWTGTFNLSDVGETYLDMSKWHFGVVWVNGHNLGRFWDVGSSRALYLPSVWEKSGENQITVLELGTPPGDAEVKGVENMVETKVKAFAPYWTNGEKQGLKHVAGQGDEGGGVQ
ncbi:MAG: beta-galactosidase [Phycisphaerae bacterium]